MGEVGQLSTRGRGQTGAISPLCNRTTGRKPFLIGFLAFCNRTRWRGRVRLRILRSPYFIAFRPVVRLRNPL
jgi:hypothetical protein